MTALVVGSRRLSAAELDDRVRRYAAVLATRGVQAGHRVLLVLPNSEAVFELQFAVRRLGAQPILLNPRLTDDELDWIAADSGARLVVREAELDAYERAADSISPVGGDAQTADGRLVMYTSGTTGRPKRVEHRLDAVDMAQAARDLWGITAADVHLLSGPAYHGAPWSYAAMHLAVGATVVVMPRFDAAEWLRLVAAERVTTTFMVPSHFVRILELPREERDRFDVSSLRLIVHGGEACAPALKWRVLDWLTTADVWEIYGFTEGGRLTRIGADEWRAHPGSVGRPLPGVELAVLDADGTPLPPEHTGSIAVRRDGWVSGGDLGHFDADGYLFVTDRSAELIVRGGVNVSPREVERVLLEHPAVRDATVFGVPDERVGERVHALVELRADVDAGELERHCRHYLAKVKCPQVEIVTELPRDPSGRVRKALLRERYRNVVGASHA